MKNILVIDGALNCAYNIYASSNETFKEIFPGKSQDIEFIEDFFARVGKKRAAKLLKPLWENRQEKHLARGIHGTLFYELKFKKKFYPNKREEDLGQGIGPGWLQVLKECPVPMDNLPPRRRAYPHHKR
jgi:hypothetical protein